MSWTFNTKVYTADQYGLDAVGYAGVLKTLTVADDLQLSRVPAKPTSVFSGVSRTQAKMTRTLTLTGALTPTGKAILSINVSIPVGAASADIDALLNDMGAALSHANFKTHVKSLQLTF